jgi:antitoxin FitA
VNGCRCILQRIPALLQIRNVPEETRRALKVRAAARGESLNAYLLDLIERDVASPTVGEVLARAARRAERADRSALGAVLRGRAERGEHDDPGRTT